MGEIADMMLDGTLCQICGVYMGEDVGDGYPLTCSACSSDKPKKRKKKRKKPAAPKPAVRP